MVARRTPTRSASSCWVQPRRCRSWRMRNSKGDLGVKIMKMAPYVVYVQSVHYQRWRPAGCWLLTGTVLAESTALRRQIEYLRRQLANLYHGVRAIVRTQLQRQPQRPRRKQRRQKRSTHRRRA